MLTRRAVQNPWDVWVTLSCDYAALEMTTLAEVCHVMGFGDALMTAINDGRDLHVDLSAEFLGIDYLAALEKKKAKEIGFLKLRQAAKPVNYGKAGLMGPSKMVKTQRKEGIYFCELADNWEGEPAKGCRAIPRVTEYRWGPRADQAFPISPTCTRCLEVAKALGTSWYTRWEGTRAYHKWCSELATGCSHGRPFESFPDFDGSPGMARMETNPGGVANHFFQNLAARGAKDAAYAVCEEMYNKPGSVLYNNARLNVFAHDELLFEARLPVAHECGWRVAQISHDRMQIRTPHVRQEIRPAMMRRWFKSAEEVNDKNGRLKPWWPTDSRCKPLEHQHAEHCGCWKYGPDQELMLADLAA